MTQLFQNLIGNALKFRRPDLQAEITVTVAGDQHSGWTFTVKDNGIGIKKESAEKVFAIFQRLHSRDTYPGTGIGLAICKKIVEKHHGKIWLESDPDQKTGTTFFFILNNEAT